MECSKRIQKLSIQAHDGFQLFEKLIELLETAEVEVVVCLARSIWLRRNTVVFGGYFSSPTQLVKQGIASLEEFHVAIQDSVTVVGTSGDSELQKWQRPLEGFIKINWDAAIDKANHQMGVGVLARDAEGVVVASLCATIPSISDPGVAETMALWRAVALCRELEFPAVHLEGDSLELVQTLLQQGDCWKRHGQLIEDIRQSLSYFSSWHISYVRRVANAGAHTLARAAATKSINLLWRDSYPDFLHNLVILEQGHS